MNALDLFSGMGGAALAIEKTGLFKTVGYCDNNVKSQDLLNALMKYKLLPTAPIYPDVCKLKATSLPKIDLISAGFPCQDVSSTGKRSRLSKGVRTRLVFEVIRLCKELKPGYVFLENVTGLLSDPRYMTILKALRKLNYDFAMGVFDAASQGAQHLRMRWFLFARLSGRKALKLPENQLRRYIKTAGIEDLKDLKDQQTSPTLCKFIGNAVVPACAFEAMRQLDNYMDSEPMKSVQESSLSDRHIHRWLTKNKKPDFMAPYKVSTCKGGPYILKKPDYSKFTPANSVSSPIMKKDHKVNCLPTPRTGTNSVIHSYPTIRALGDMGTALNALDGFKRRGILSHKALIGIMGFPPKWLQAFRASGIM